MSDVQTRAIWRAARGPDGVTTLWFDSPGRSQNVLDVAALDELDARLSEIADDDSIRGVLVRSGKPGGFCAGADLKTILACNTPAELASYLQRGLSLLDRLAGLKVPTAAVVHGACLGGGLELALACRCRIALASQVPLQIGSPEVQLGLIPAWGAIVRLPRLLAPRDALDILLTGNPLGFLQAKSQGLVDRLVSQDEQDRITQGLSREPAGERPLAADGWSEAIEFAAAKAEDQPADFPDVQRIIIELIETDLANGPEAARAAATERCVEMAFQPATRQAMTDFFNRRRAQPGR
jgi:3-hydroxyacyl-CoA dehydrogenase/enoyl-CoA hydratase/3-hydroxybutyryl-CoA epimerase